MERKKQDAKSEKEDAEIMSMLSCVSFRQKGGANGFVASKKDTLVLHTTTLLCFSSY